MTGRGLPDSPATPAYGSVEIARDAVVSSASGRIEDVLATRVAGFQQFRRSDSRSSNPSAQGVTLRALGGNASSRTLVLLDGVPVTNPFFGYVPLSALSPDRVASIRVTRGGGSGAFGSGAVAGTIELASVGPETTGLASARLLANDRGGTEAALNIAPRIGAGYLLASARWDRSRGFWTTPEDQRVPASARAAYNSWSGAVRMVAPVTPTVEIQASGLGWDDHRTLRFAGAESSSSGQQASLRAVGTGNWQFDVLGYVQAQNFSNVVISSSSYAKVLDQVKTPSTGLGGKVEVRPPVGSGHLLRIGADWRRSTGNLVEEPFRNGAATEHRRAGGVNSNLGIYVEGDWTLGALVLTAGARADRWRQAGGFYSARDAATGTTSRETFAARQGWTANGRAGALLHLGEALDLRAAVYTGLRQPTLNELYRPFVVFPVVTQANAALDPERLRGFEAGLDWRPLPGTRLSLTAFDNRVRDAVANVTLTPTLRQRQNVDAVRSQGLEADAGLALGAVSLTGSVALTRARVEGSGASLALDGMRPSQVPALAGAATLAWTPAPRWRLAVTVRHVGKQFEDDLETQSLPAATTLDAFARVPFSRRFSLVLRGENLLDETVITRNQSGSMDLGAPRTLWAGIEIALD